MAEVFSCKNLQKNLPGLDSETCNSFLANNQTSAVIDCSKSPPRGRSVVMSEDERFGPGHVSRPGLSEDGKMALFFVDHVALAVYLLRLKHEKWTVWQTLPVGVH